VIKSAHARDNLKFRGDLQIETFDRTGRLLRRMAMRNTIVFAGRNSVLYLWSQDSGSPTDWRIVKLVPGTNGTPPTVGDTAMGAAVGLSDQITLVGANRQVVPATGELIITGTLTTGQANGLDLKEIGLFMGNGQLFARQIHPTISKSNAISVSYTWRLATTT
jgi:hypothetical protein